MDKPVPNENEVLIAVHAASVNPLDCSVPRGGGRLVTGLLKPRFTRLGIDVAGTVKSIGRAVIRFKPGDAVFGVAPPKILRMAAGPMILFSIVSAWIGSKVIKTKMVSFMARPVAEDLAMIRELISAGSITPVIGRIFSLNNVSDALRYLEGRHARGKVVISLAARTPSHVQQLCIGF
jgi:NADPH:quinone reductase-like Zn-dependent oxidoreductase